MGDVSVLGFNANAPDNFAFVTWVPIAANTYVKFTDSGFNSANASTAAANLRGSENYVIWRNTTASTIAAGTVIKIEGLTASLGTCTAGSASGLGGISSSGDQIFAYQGAATSGATPDAGSTGTATFTGTPVFLLTFPSAFLTTGTASSNTSYLPSDLNVTNGKHRDYNRQRNERTVHWLAHYPDHIRCLQDSGKQSSQLDCVDGDRPHDFEYDGVHVVRTDADHHRCRDGLGVHDDLRHRFRATDLPNFRQQFDG